MSVNKWVNKQLWRVKQTYLVFQPMVNIVQLLLWLVIAIGVNEWFTLSWEIFVFIILGTLLSLNLVGYGFDKRGFFLEHEIRRFKIAYPEVWNSQTRYQAALIAKNMRLTDDAIDKMIEIHAKELGLSE